MIIFRILKELTIWTSSMYAAVQSSYPLVFVQLLRELLRQVVLWGALTNICSKMSSADKKKSHVCVIIYDVRDVNTMVGSVRGVPQKGNMIRIPLCDYFLRYFNAFTRLNENQDLWCTSSYLHSLILNIASSRNALSSMSSMFLTWKKTKSRRTQRKRKHL